MIDPRLVQQAASQQARDRVIVGDVHEAIRGLIQNYRDSGRQGI